VSLTPSECELPASVFAQELSTFLGHCNAQGVRALWLQIPLSASQFVPVAVSQGFTYHHAQPKYLMLIKWVPGGPVPSNIPSYAHHQIGVAGMVLDEGNVLCIQEAHGVTAGRKDFWKLPGGLVETREGIREAVEREVFEETGLKVSFVSLAAFRESHTAPFGGSDFYCICACRLKPGQRELSPRPQPGEIAAVKWMPLSQFLGSPYYARGIYGTMLKSAAAAAKVALESDNANYAAGGFKEVVLPALGGKLESLFSVSKL